MWPAMRCLHGELFQASGVGRNPERAHTYEPPSSAVILRQASPVQVFWQGNNNFWPMSFRTHTLASWLLPRSC